MAATYIEAKDIQVGDVVYIPDRTLGLGQPMSDEVVEVNKRERDIIIETEEGEEFSMFRRERIRLKESYDLED